MAIAAPMPRPAPSPSATRAFQCRVGTSRWPGGCGVSEPGIDAFLARDRQCGGHRTVPVGSTVPLPRGGRCRAEVLVRSRGTAREARRLGERDRRPRHRRARARDHAAEVRDRPGQLPQQGRAGLQGQRRLPAAVRRPGDAHRHHDGRPATRSTSSSTPNGRAQFTRFHDALITKRPGQRASSRRSRSCSSPTRSCRARTATRPRASPARRCSPRRPRSRRDRPRPRRGPTDALDDAAAARRGPRARSAPSTTPSGSSSSSTTTRARSGRPCGRSSSTAARADRHPAARATSRSRPRARPRCWCSRRPKKLHFAEHDDGHDGRVRAAQGPQRLPARRDVDARRDRRA